MVEEPPKNGGRLCFEPRAGRAVAAKPASSPSCCDIHRAVSLVPAAADRGVVVPGNAPSLSANAEVVIFVCTVYPQGSEPFLTTRTPCWDVRLAGVGDVALDSPMLSLFVHFFFLLFFRFMLTTYSIVFVDIPTYSIALLICNTISKSSWVIHLLPARSKINFSR